MKVKKNRKKEKSGRLFKNVFLTLGKVSLGAILVLVCLNFSSPDKREKITGFWDRVVMATQIVFSEEEDLEELSCGANFEPSSELLADNIEPFDVVEEITFLKSGRVEKSREILKRKFQTGSLKRLLSSRQIANLIAVESDGKNGLVGDKQLGEDPNLWAYGVLQVRKVYVDDVNKTCGTAIYASDCQWDPELSVLVTQAYMNRYARKDLLKRSPTFEDMARIHNGGPNGWKYKSTDRYWGKVSKSENKTPDILALYKEEVSS